MKYNKSIVPEEYIETREKFMENLSESVKKSFDMIFNKVTVYENQTGIAFEEWSDENIWEFISKYLISKSVNSMCVKLSLIRRYYRYIGKEAAENISREDLRKLIDRDNEIGEKGDPIYISWLHIVEAMEDKLQYYIDKAIICLLRLGLYKEIKDIKIDEFDFINNELRVDDKIYKFDNYMKEIFMEARDEAGVERQMSNGDVQFISYNSSSPYLVKTRPLPKTAYGLQPYGEVGMNGRLSKIFSKLNLGITAINILQFGLAEEVVEMEMKTNINMSRSQVLIWLKTKDKHFYEYDIYTLKETIKKVNKQNKNSNI